MPQFTRLIKMEPVGAEPTSSALYRHVKMGADEGELIYNILCTKPLKVLVVIHESKSILLQGA
jgi:hypothetical protein